MNKNLSLLPASATITLADRIRTLKCAGKEIVALQTGDPDFPTPAPIVEAAYKAIRDGLTHYSDSSGLPVLRQAIAEKILSENGGLYDPGTEILVTNGGVHAYYCALAAIVNPGDEVLVPDPSWMTHVNTVAMLGGVPKRVASNIEQEFWPAIDEIEKTISPKTVALVLNSPNNPTGAVASFSYLQQIVDLAQRHGLYIISDEVYEYILFDEAKHISLAKFKKQYKKIIIVNSFSKSYAMTGWRIGYLAAPEKVISIALKASQNTITNVASFIQMAALSALTDAGVKKIVEKMMEGYAVRRNSALDLLKRSESQIYAFKPKGAFYLFINVENMRKSSAEIAECLLNEAQIAMVPGSVYGHYGEGFLRMTLAASETSIEKGLNGLIKWGRKPL